MFESHTFWPPHPRLHLVLWPCGGGNALNYPIDTAQLGAARVAVTRFNPGGHGKSTGPFSFDATIDGLNAHLSRFPDVPRAAIGHSMGTYGALRGAPTLGLQHVLGVAPIPDSRTSVQFMHANGRIHDFIRLFPVAAEHRPRVVELLADLRWLDPDHFATIEHELDVPCLAHFSIPSLAGFLREVFMPGYTIWDLPDARPDRFHILAASEDTFYPQDKLRAVALAHEVPVTTIPGATDHLFRHAWPDVWSWVLRHHPLLQP